MNYTAVKAAEAYERGLADGRAEVTAQIAAAEERGRRAEHDRAQGVIHVLHQCIRGKCACADNGAYSQFACEDTARKAIDAWDLAPRDSGKEDRK